MSLPHCHGVDRCSAGGCWARRWQHWCGCNTALRFDEAAYVEILFPRCAEAELYPRLAVIIWNNLDLANAATVS